MIQTQERTSAKETTSARRKSVTVREAIDPEMRHLGVGIDTARYGHHVSFLREDKQPACPALQIITELVGELRHSLAEEKRWLKLLLKAFDALPDRPHRQIATINGIGPQTAAALVATAVDIKRFPTAKHFIGK